ncbi:alanine racemase [Congregibacter litoralis]|uniref:Alanine racemase n=1 Tax=Congregibacter litoralis KT71 TaxID=314285 RepID=A4A412_9GAMM|nr:alanine racemase [Congregibacter litoralis]EAQ99435.1 alanine racemase [Congregibacter litoralis KT71]
MARPTLARILTGNLRHNARRVREEAPRSRIMACVKADAYGHGITTASEALNDIVDGFAVACISEALALRDAGIKKPVLMLEGPQSPDEVPEAAHKDLTLCVNEWHQLEWLEKAGLSAPLACWLKIDTGMHRLGFSPQRTAEALQRLERKAKNPELVLCTHFSSADLPKDNGVEAQVRAFDEVAATTAYAHSLANSAAILTIPESHRHWVRPGYMLYGGSPLADAAAATLNLKPAMEFVAEVISVRDVSVGERVGYRGRWEARRPSRIATVAAGYGDGYPRHAPDGTPVFINGKVAPLAGRVSMDMITVDVTEHPDIAVGAKAVLWGGEPTVDEVATAADTIGYEILAGMPKRVPRVVED